MSNLRNGPKPRPTGPAASDPSSRPKLWVEGSQQPKFELRAWGRVSLTMTRRRLAPAMTAGAGWTDAFAQRILRGELRPNLAWTGRAQRFIPSHQAVGAAVLGCAHMLSAAREIVQPTPPPAEAVAYPNLIRPDFSEGPRATRRRLAETAPASSPADPATQPPPPDQSTLRTIRAVIGTPDAPADALPSQQESPEPLPPRLTQRARSAVSGLIWRAGAVTLAWGLTALIFPIGGIHAALFHLNGGDLRDWT